MNAKQLLGALSEECRTENGRAADFLNALSDLLADTLAAEGRVIAGPLGTFYMTQHRAVGFRASDGLRKRLGAVDVKLPAIFKRPACKIAGCGLPAKVRYHFDKKCPKHVEAGRKKKS